MKKWVTPVLTVLTLGLTVFFTGCSDDGGFITEPPEAQVQLSGVVYAWYCLPRCISNNRDPVESYRFSIRTGERATVSLIDNDGHVTAGETDRLSEFTKSIPPGSYRIIIETGYTWPPDTFENVNLVPGDTSIDFDLVFAVTDPLFLDIQFVYEDAQDTLGAPREWEALHELNLRACEPGQMVPLAIPETSPDHVYRVVDVDQWGEAYVTYMIPINRVDDDGNLRNLIPVMFRLRETLTVDSSNVLPDNTWINPTGSYLCPF